MLSQQATAYYPTIKAEPFQTTFPSLNRPLFSMPIPDGRFSPVLQVFETETDFGVQLAPSAPAPTVIHQDGPVEESRGCPKQAASGGCQEAESKCQPTADLTPNPDMQKGQTFLERKLVSCIEFLQTYEFDMQKIAPEEKHAAFSRISKELGLDPNTRDSHEVLRSACKYVRTKLYPSYLKAVDEGTSFVKSTSRTTMFIAFYPPPNPAFFFPL